MTIFVKNDSSVPMTPVLPVRSSYSLSIISIALFVPNDSTPP